MDAKILQAQLLELMRRTSTRLPGDVVLSFEKGWR